MPTKYSALHLAAASVATGLLTLGSVLPAYAADNGDHSSQRSQRGAHHASGEHREEAEGSADAPRGSARRESGSASRSRTPASSAHNEHRSQDQSAASESAPKSRGYAGESHGRANPPRHTPVTVCHRLGNGSYHLLTIDDSALKAHLGHGDELPGTDGGCLTTSAPASGQRRGLLPGTTPVTGAAPTAGEALVIDVAPGSAEQVLGVEKAILTRLGLSGIALDVQQERSAYRTPAQLTAARGSTAEVAGEQTAAAPRTGVLPQTGAGQIGFTVVAGLGLLAAGAGMLSRRRLLVGR